MQDGTTTRLRSKEAGRRRRDETLISSFKRKYQSHLKRTHAYHN